MINLYPTQIEKVAIHKVGNKSRNEKVFLSKTPTRLDDESNALMKEFLLKPFRTSEENYFNFVHEVDLHFNVIYALASNVFKNNGHFMDASRGIAAHLFEQSQHPHIKSGEIYVVLFSNILFDNEKVNALGIFKSELKHDFFQFKENETSLDILIQQGININKLDKGCLILDVEAENGYKLLSTDSNRYDTKYWLQNFLGIESLADEIFYTKKYLKFCQDFAKDIVRPSEDKKEEVLFLNRAVNHFAKNDAFNEATFLNEVFENPELIPEYKHYKIEKGPKYSIEDVSSFDIDNTAVSVARKKIKNVIQLDTNVTIKLDFINPESAEKFVEKGWDEERQMYYYLVYFNKEVK